MKIKTLLIIILALCVGNMLCMYFNAPPQEYPPQPVLLKHYLDTLPEPPPPPLSSDKKINEPFKIMKK